DPHRDGDPTATPTATDEPTATPTATAIPTATPTATIVIVLPTETPTATPLAGTVELSVTLQGATQVAPGARQAFTVQVTNSGTTNTTTPVTITVQVPISTTFNATNSNPNWRELTPATREQGAIYGLTLDPPLGTGLTVPLSFTVEVPASVPEGTLLNVPATLNWTDASGQAQTSATRAEVQVAFFRAYLPLVVRAAILPADTFPDLVGAIRLIPSQTRFEPGAPVLIEVVVTNQGEAPSNAGFWVDLYINPASPPRQNQLWPTVCGLFPCQGVSWSISDTLEIGQSMILTSTLASYRQEFTIWQGSFITGTTDLYGYVDVWDPDTTVGAVFEGEAGEQNNVTRLSGLNVPGLRLMLRDEELPMVPPRPAIPLQR
ncbi:MAG: hypothetical protein HC911_15670, partial [Chloroflexaceae bacterium]|nr:hypothetical protein [Chloroflexaceae bacterium]